MFDLTRYPEPAQVWFRRGLPFWHTALGAAIDAGLRDADDLADLMFYMHHPERMRGIFGIALEKGDEQFQAMAEQWAGFREIVAEVIPVSVGPSKPRDHRHTVGDGFDEQEELGRLELAILDHQHASDSRDEKQALRHVTRHIKRLLRCTGDPGPAERLVRDALKADASQAIDKSRLPLGGYLAAVPRWAGPVSVALQGLGADIASLNHHAIPPVTEETEPWKDYRHRRLSKESAPGNSRILKQVDIVGLLGHHYTSHLAPGFFADTGTMHGFDLRYCLALDPGGYPNVAVFAASGCSSLCRGAQKVLSDCFSNAWFLGAQHTMTLETGKHLWPAFRSNLTQDATPLLLDNDQDLGALAFAWDQACLAASEAEARRLLEQDKVTVTRENVAHRQRRLIQDIGYGFGRRGTVHVLQQDGRSIEIPVDDDVNKCDRVADDRRHLPAPDA